MTKLAKMDMLKNTARKKKIQTGGYILILNCWTRGISDTCNERKDI